MAGCENKYIVGVIFEERVFARKFRHQFYMLYNIIRLISSEISLQLVVCDDNHSSVEEEEVNLCILYLKLLERVSWIYYTLFKQILEKEVNLCIASKTAGESKLALLYFIF